MPAGFFSLASFLEGMMEISDNGRSPGFSSFPDYASSGFLIELQLRVSFRFSRNSLFIRPKMKLVRTPFPNVNEQIYTNIRNIFT
jgi:hypothetical protein